MLNQICELEKKAMEEIKAAADYRQLTEIRNSYLGKKGTVTSLLRGIGQVPATIRPQVGQRTNALRRLIEDLLADRERSLDQSMAAGKWEKERIDVTLPGRPVPKGANIPATILDEIKQIFTGLGFRWPGADVESDYHNFEALNIRPSSGAGDAGFFLSFASPVACPIPHRFRSGPWNRLPPNRCGSSPRAGLPPR